MLLSRSVGEELEEGHFLISSKFLYDINIWLPYQSS